MAVRIGINGFGRIGRIALRAMIKRHRKNLQVVAINDLAPPENNAHLFKYDTCYGEFPGTAVVEKGCLVINDQPIAVFSEREPGRIPWQKARVDVVIESTGLFTDATLARAHLRGSVRKVVISAPARNEDLTVVMGVNHKEYHPRKHRIISNASCTTNGLAPVAKVLNDRFGIELGLLTTVHSYTNSQRLLDMVGRGDLRDARAAAENIVPSETGAARAVGLVIPDLKGKFQGMAFRVPTPTVSVIDFVALLRKPAGKEEINRAMQKAAQGAMRGILAYTDLALVSSDMKGNDHSSIFSGCDTLVLDNMVKVLSWYDNEWGYSCRLGDLVAYLGKVGL